MKDVFIVSALRTPFGSSGGSLADITAPELTSQVISKLLQRSSLPGEQIDEVIIGQVSSGRHSSSTGQTGDACLNQYNGLFS